MLKTQICVTRPQCVKTNHSTENLSANFFSPPYKNSVSYLTADTGYLLPTNTDGVTVFRVIIVVCQNMIYINTLLTPWSRVLLEKLISSLLVKKFPTFYAHEGSLPHSQVLANCPYPEPHRSHPTSWRFSLILSSHLRLDLPNGLFPSGFSTKTLYTHLLSPIFATCPVNLILLDLITRKILGEG